jgi:DNA polymerase-3 subunit delta
MIQVLFSSQSRMVQGALNKLFHASNETHDAMNYVSLNMREATLLELVGECEALPIGYDKKTVVAEDCFFLEKSRSKPKLQKGDDDKPFLAYLANPDPLIDLYLLVYNDGLDERGSYFQALKATGAKFSQVPTFTPEQWKQFIGNYFVKRGCEIDPLAVAELQERCGGDYAMFLSEGQKLLTYANGEKISKKTVETLVSAPLEDDAFHLSNALSRGDVKKALAIYQDLKVQNVDEVPLIRLLAGQFRFLNEVSFLNKKGFDNYAIANALACSAFRVSIALDNLRKMKDESCNNALEQLYRCEYSILSGKSDASLAFSLFLANYHL